MQIHQLSETSSVLNQFLFEIRSVSIQNDSMRFRRNIERIGEILSFEMSKALEFKDAVAKTPLGEKVVSVPKHELVICSILRAGLNLHAGVLNYFDQAENAFISAYRKHDEDYPSNFKILVDYMACPDLNNKVLVLVDPMLATGRSLSLTYEALLKHGQPKKVHVMSVIGSREGVDAVRSSFPDNSHLWIADIDDHLDENAYIVPGLGDAGDLSYGKKL